jgi:hypothetical protein
MCVDTRVEGYDRAQPFLYNTLSAITRKVGIVPRSFSSFTSFPRESADIFLYFLFSAQPKRYKECVLPATHSLHTVEKERKYDESLSQLDDTNKY